MKGRIKTPDVPINAIVFLILAVFVLQAGLVMYYNNWNMTFTHVETFSAFEKGDLIANGDFRGHVKFKKEINGLLYPIIIAGVIKVVGVSNTITAIYILNLLMFFFATVFFYKVAFSMMGKSLGMPATVIFATTAPIVLGVFSGTEASLVILLVAMNIFYSFFALEKKRYAGVVITAIIMSLVNLTGLIFGLCSILYILIKINAKIVKKNYKVVMWSVFTVAFLGFSAILVSIFMQKLTLVSLQNGGILDTKTFYIDTFFKDGFLWSKIFPPFFTIFFYIFFFFNMAEEMKNKRSGIIVYFGLLTMAAFLMGFFASFAKGTDTTLFVSPFYFVVILIAVLGIEQFAGFIQDKKSEIFNKKNILFGIIVFVILYNVIFFFNKTIEQNQKIKYLSSNKIAVKFLER